MRGGLVRDAFLEQGLVRLLFCGWPSISWPLSCPPPATKGGGFLTKGQEAPNRTSARASTRRAFCGAFLRLRVRAGIVLFARRSQRSALGFAAPWVGPIHRQED